MLLFDALETLSAKDKFWVGHRIRQEEISIAFAPVNPFDYISLFFKVSLVVNKLKLWKSLEKDKMHHLSPTTMK